MISHTICMKFKVTVMENGSTTSSCYWFVCVWLSWIFTYIKHHLILGIGAWCLSYSTVHHFMGQVTSIVMDTKS